MFDEMSLCPNLQYSTKNCVVIGYSDGGTERTAGLANTAFVVLSGISTSWAQPLAFAVVKRKLHAEVIKRLLFALIKILREVQLFVEAVVCDEGSSNIRLFEILK